MDKKLIIILTVIGLLWGFGLSLYFYPQSESTSTSAVAVLSVAKPLPISTQNQTPVTTSTSTTTPVTILAFGDMMLDRGVREKINTFGPEYPFALIKDFLKGDGNANDIVVTNAEGPFTDNPSVTLGIKNAPLQFTFDPAMLSTLKNLGFTLLDQANNHSLNFGLTDFDQSTTSITATGLNWFGDPRNEFVKPYITDIRGEKVAFIGYNEFAYHGLNNILQAIKNTKTNSTFVVVYSHWGIEYDSNATTSQEKAAHAFIDVGADVVIGSHPHVIQPIEVYKNKPIFYSLGNFIFDQPADAPTGRGLAIKISLTSNLVTYGLFPISIKNEQASLMTDEDRQKILDNLGVQNAEIKLPR